MSKKNDLTTSTRMHWFAFATVVAYGLLLLVMPTSIRAVDASELPTVQSLQDEVTKVFCDHVGEFVLCTPNGGGSDGGSGGGTDGGSGGGNTGGGSGGTGGGSIGESITMGIRTPGGTYITSDLSLSFDGVTETIVTPTSGGTPVTINPKSVLAMLRAFDTRSSAFRISNLEYFESFGSFYLKCIDMKSGGELCDSWQYAVNGTFPQVGIDKYILKSGDKVQLFFGTPHVVRVPSMVTAGSAFTAVVEAYDPEHNTYAPVGGYTVGIIQDSTSSSSYVEVASSSTNSSGQATFTLSTVGAYKAGVREEYYLGATPFTVAAAGSSATGGSSGGGSSHASGAVHQVFDVPAARAFIASLQATNGSFGPALYTDWSSIALATGEASSSAYRLARIHARLDTAPLANATDYERHAMALMALDIDPYTGTSRDLIKGLLGYFDGAQIGDSHRINDDIFGLVVLERAGFTSSDLVVRTVLTHVLAAQGANGAWDDSVDLTAAAIQAIMPFHSDPGVASALTKAAVFLRVKQGADGGFGDAFATSWVLQAIDALGQRPTDWKKGSGDPLSYLALRQEQDGGVGTASTPELTRLWATAYAVPGAAGRTWRELLHSFSRPQGWSFVSAGVGSAASAGGAQASTDGLSGVAATGAGDAGSSDSGSADAGEQATTGTSTVSGTPSINDLLANTANADANTKSTLIRYLAGAFILVLLGFAGIGLFRAMRS